jgi:inner membrane protein YidH
VSVQHGAVIDCVQSSTLRQREESPFVLPACRDASAKDMDEATRLALDRTRLAGTRTNLALRRNAMAAERSLMAWIRTCLAMISFGFTIGKLGSALASAEVKIFGRTADVAGVAYFLVSVGTLALMLAAIQYRIEMADLIRSGLHRRRSLAFSIAILLSLLGVFAFTDLVTRL